jgi:riboflavin kinase/FMN adenylyltransferase
VKVQHWDDILNQGTTDQIQPSAATIGVFDGLHIGHMELLRRVTGQAPRLLPLAITFSENPKKSTRPHKPSGNLISLDQKLELMEAAGIQVCVLIDFSVNFSRMGGYDFISILVKSCGVHTFVVGSDFKCGHRLSTDALSLGQIARSLGSETEIVDPVRLDDLVVSSSRIRTTILEGRMDQALAMLGRPYTLDLRSVRLEYDKGRVSTSIPSMGAVVPHQGSYAVQLADGQHNHLATALVGADGTLSWVQMEGYEPQFMNFLYHIG